MMSRRPPPSTVSLEVAIIGGGCASMAAAFDLTRPEQGGRFHVTVYQVGWRLGGKGASGRGPSGRIEEHGLHVWLGFYDNAFRLLRDCYAELDRDPRHPFATWRDAFVEDSHVGVADRSRDGWRIWTATLPRGPGLPGDPVTEGAFALHTYLAQAVRLVRSLMLGLESSQSEAAAEATADAESDAGRYDEPASLAARLGRLARGGLRIGAAGLAQALALVEAALRAVPVLPQTLVVEAVIAVGAALRRRLAKVVAQSDEVRFRWEIVDLVQAILVGTVRDGLLWSKTGLDAIDHYECREWLLRHGASRRSVESPFLRGLYDLALAYEDGDPARPAAAAGQALRGCFRMFFSTRGSSFWKMRAGMGDIVFAPLYEVLRRRGVTFRFFHRLTRVGLSEPGEDGRRHAAELEFDVQAEMRHGHEYQPLIRVKGVECWPSRPLFDQLKDGGALEREGREFESFWDRRKVRTCTRKVGRDFDFVVLGLSIGAIPDVAGELIADSPRWARMVERVKTVATQAFQLWLREDLPTLGWQLPPVTLSAFSKPFDTWADMTHLVPFEDWETMPRSLAYFCNVLPEAPADEPRDAGFPARQLEVVRRNAEAFLDGDLLHLWPGAADPSGRFRRDLLVDAAPADEECAGIGGQFVTANVNPSDRYVLALPGTIADRISPLDETYDNLTIAGDWTACGFNQGCVEGAVMSGRLASHALSRFPALEDIPGYDHP